MWVLSFIALFLICFQVTIQQCACGKSMSSRLESNFITNGNNVTNSSKYPWMAQILISNRGALVSRCTGSIVARQWIVTAGHCINSSEISVFVGTTQIVNNIHGSLKISQIIRHPNYYYYKQTFDYDIALIKLATPLNYDRNIQPICLPLSSAIMSFPSSLIAAGWGVLNNDVSFASTLQEVQLTENTSCFWQKDFKRKIHICTQIRGGKSTCYGDDGGPLMYEMNGSFNLVGITSGIIGPYRCGTEGANNYFTRVSTFADWIRRHINNNQC
ncbi:unnamed protein product [Cunninghamella echinulata]